MRVLRMVKAKAAGLARGVASRRWLRNSLLVSEAVAVGLLALFAFRTPQQPTAPRLAFVQHADDSGSAPTSTTTTPPATTTSSSVPGLGGLVSGGPGSASPSPSRSLPSGNTASTPTTSTPDDEHTDDEHTDEQRTDDDHHHAGPTWWSAVVTVSSTLGILHWLAGNHGRLHAGRRDDVGDRHHGNWARLLAGRHGRRLRALVFRRILRRRSRHSDAGTVAVHGPLRRDRSQHHGGRRHSVHDGAYWRRENKGTAAMCWRGGGSSEDSGPALGRGACRRRPWWALGRDHGRRRRWRVVHRRCRVGRHLVHRLGGGRVRGGHEHSVTVARLTYSAR